MANLDYTPTFTTTSIFTHGHFHFHSWSLPIMHPLWPPLTFSHLYTSDYTPTLTITSIFTHGNFRFCNHIDHHCHFHTWPLQITHPLWPPLPFSLMATSDSTLILTLTSTFTHGHLGLHTHFDYHFHFHTLPLWITHPLWPPLPFSYILTSDYTPTLTTMSTFTHGPFRFCTHFDHHFHFHSWPLQIMHLLWPPLPFWHMATSDSAPPLTTTSIFTHGHFGFCTHFDHHLHFHTWPLWILHPLWPPLHLYAWPLQIPHTVWPPLPIEFMLHSIT